MNRWSWRPAPFLAMPMAMVMAVAVPAAVLDALSGTGGRASGLVASPFGWRGLLVVQLAAALPLALIAVSRCAGPGSTPPLWACATLGLGLAVVAALAGPALGVALDAVGAGFIARASVRTALAWLLVFPWLVPLGRPFATTAARHWGWSAGAAAAIVALLPPAAYARRLVEVRSTGLDSDLKTGRLAKALGVLEGLVEIGSTRPVGRLTPPQARSATAAALRRIRLAVSKDLPTSATLDDRLERAFLLVQLDRPRPAESILRPLAAADPDAALLLAAVYRDQGRWRECENLYRSVLAATPPDAGRDPAARERCLTAHDGLAEAARSLGQPRDAERVYQEARRQLPDRAAYFAYQLGRQYQGDGRPAAALAQFREAVRLDPAFETEVELLIRQLRVRTPACLLSH